LCDVAVVFDLVLELVLFDEVVELPAKSSRFVDVVDCFVVGENVVDAARFALFLVAALEALVLGLAFVSRRSERLSKATRPRSSPTAVSSSRSGRSTPIRSRSSSSRSSSASRFLRFFLRRRSLRASASSSSSSSSAMKPAPSCLISWAVCHRPRHRSLHLPLRRCLHRRLCRKGPS
jgi:hypothetical protein